MSIGDLAVPGDCPSSPGQSTTPGTHNTSPGQTDTTAAADLRATTSETCACEEHVESGISGYTYSELLDKSVAECCAFCLADPQCNAAVSGKDDKCRLKNVPGDVYGLINPNNINNNAVLVKACPQTTPGSYSSSLSTPASAPCGCQVHKGYGINDQDVAGGVMGKIGEQGCCEACQASPQCTASAIASDGTCRLKTPPDPLAAMVSKGAGFMTLIPDCSITLPPGSTTAKAELALNSLPSTAPQAPRTTTKPAVCCRPYPSTGILDHEVGSVSGVTQAECCEACLAESLCTAAVFRGAGVCSLKDVADPVAELDSGYDHVTLVIAPCPTDAPPVGTATTILVAGNPFTAGSTCCRVYEDAGFLLGDYTTVTAAHQDSCCAACRADPRCTAVVFREEDGDCGLKDAADPGDSLAPGYPTRTAIVMEECGGGEQTTALTAEGTTGEAAGASDATSQSPNPIAPCCRRHGSTGMDGGDTFSVSVDNQGLCCDACRSEPNCTAVVFRTDTNICLLKNVTDPAAIFYSHPDIITLILEECSLITTPSVSASSTEDWWRKVSEESTSGPSGRPSLSTQGPGQSCCRALGDTGTPHATLTSLNAASEAQCCEACQHNLLCTAAVFADGRCHIKSASDPAAGLLSDVSQLGKVTLILEPCPSTSAPTTTTTTITTGGSTSVTQFEPSSLAPETPNTSMLSSIASASLNSTASQTTSRGLTSASASDTSLPATSDTSSSSEAAKGSTSTSTSDASTAENSTSDPSATGQSPAAEMSTWSQKDSRSQSSTDASASHHPTPGALTNRVATGSVISASPSEPDMPETSTTTDETSDDSSQNPHSTATTDSGRSSEASHRAPVSDDTPDVYTTTDVGNDLAERTSSSSPPVDEHEVTEHYSTRMMVKHSTTGEEFIHQTTAPRNLDNEVPTSQETPMTKATSRGTFTGQGEVTDAAALTTTIVTNKETSTREFETTKTVGKVTSTGRENVTGQRDVTAGSLTRSLKTTAGVSDKETSAGSSIAMSTAAEEQGALTSTSLLDRQDAQSTSGDATTSLPPTSREALTSTSERGDKNEPTTSIIDEGVFLTTEADTSDELTTATVDGPSSDATGATATDEPQDEASTATPKASNEDKESSVESTPSPSRLSAKVIEALETLTNGEPIPQDVLHDIATGNPDALIDWLEEENIQVDTEKDLPPLKNQLPPELFEALAGYANDSSSYPKSTAKASASLDPAAVQALEKLAGGRAIPQPVLGHAASGDADPLKDWLDEEDIVIDPESLPPVKDQLPAEIFEALEAHAQNLGPTSTSASIKLEPNKLDPKALDALEKLSKGKPIPEGILKAAGEGEPGSLREWFDEEDVPIDAQTELVPEVEAELPPELFRALKAYAEEPDLDPLALRELEKAVGREDVFFKIPAKLTEAVQSGEYEPLIDWLDEEGVATSANQIKRLSAGAEQWDVPEGLVAALEEWFRRSLPSGALAALDDFAGQPLPKQLIDALEAGDNEQLSKFLDTEGIQPSQQQFEKLERKAPKTKISDDLIRSLVDWYESKGIVFTTTEAPSTPPPPPRTLAPGETTTPV